VADDRAAGAIDHRGGSRSCHDRVCASSSAADLPRIVERDVRKGMDHAGRTVAVDDTGRGVDEADRRQIVDGRAGAAPDRPA
ncbi:hypothetical protein, partial [Escherichia coli]|uniref:hypothetical protein n=1 Tax=Escherichia coli TaxID=562 RepID=UPI002362C1FA